MEGKEVQPGAGVHARWPGMPTGRQAHRGRRRSALARQDVAWQGLKDLAAKEVLVELRPYNPYTMVFYCLYGVYLY